MAFVIERSDGRYEIRESVSTARGPRSRTLAIFTELTADVLHAADSRAARPFDRDLVVARAEAIGLHVRRVLGSAAARTLIAQPHNIWTTYASAITAVLGRDAPPLPDHLAPMLGWVGMSPKERGEALEELLELAESITAGRALPRNDEPLRYPALAKSSR